MTAKRFNYHHDGFGAYYLCDKEKGTYEDSIIGEIWADKSDMIDLVDLLNKLSDKNEQLKEDVEYWKQVASQYSNELNVFEHCKKYKTECKDIHWSSE